MSALARFGKRPALDETIDAETTARRDPTSLCAMFGSLRVGLERKAHH